MISPKSRTKALGLLRAGVAQREVAQRCGISKGTVVGLAKSLRGTAEAPPVDAEPVASASPSVDAFTASANEISRTVAASALRVAELAERDGNSTAATRALKTTRDAANDLARAERASREHEDGFFITKAEYARAEKELFDRVAALAADLDRTGGIVCGECGRKIRVSLAQGVDAPPPGLFREASEASLAELRKGRA